MTEYPKRKKNRLENFDYSSYNAYFITICTADRKPLFWSGPEQLSDLGKCVEHCLLSIPRIYPDASLTKYCIMPDHVHLLLLLRTGRDASVDVPRIIGQMKRAVSKYAGISLWQKSYYDHVIRNDEDYLETWKYIEENPLKWRLNREC